MQFLQRKIRLSRVPVSRAHALRLQALGRRPGFAQAAAALRFRLTVLSAALRRLRTLPSAAPRFRQAMFLLPVLLLLSCQKGEELPPLEIVYPYPDGAAALAAPKILARSLLGVPVFDGGYGAAMARVPGEEGVFYFLTDRGPVTAGPQTGETVFIAKRFNPHIAKYKLTGDSLSLVTRIDLRAGEENLSGLLNPLGVGGTGETALDTLGQLIEPDPNGIDPGGLAVAPDGSFWVSEEYGPRLLHFQANGQLLEKLDPFAPAPSGNSLPAVLSRRRAGAGMTGLAVLPGEAGLAAIMQAPLENPAGTSESLFTRLLLFDPAAGESRQFLYRLEDESTSVRDILALSDTTFLVLESDDGFSGDTQAPSRYKRLYRIAITGASDVSDPDDGDGGMLVGGRTLEQLTEGELSGEGIRPVSKELLLDLLTALPDYPHNLPGGMALIGSGKIAIVNEDNYGIRPSGLTGGYEPKLLPGTGTTDRTTVYFIDLPSAILP